MQLMDGSHISAATAAPSTPATNTSPPADFSKKRIVTCTGAVLLAINDPNLATHPHKLYLCKDKSCDKRHTLGIIRSAVDAARTAAGPTVKASAPVTANQSSVYPSLAFASAQDLPHSAYILDDGANTYTANSSGIDTHSIHNIIPTSIACIKGWCTITQAGIMSILGTPLPCSYTPDAPFSIVPLDCIIQSDQFDLDEIRDNFGHVSRKTITHRASKTQRHFDKMFGLYIHIPPSSIALPIAAASPDLTIEMPKPWLHGINQLTFNQREKHGLHRVYQLLEGGSSYNEIESLIRTRIIPSVTPDDIANAKLALGDDKAWLSGNNTLM